jgi:hypothetical protein
MFSCGDINFSVNLITALNIMIVGIALLVSYAGGSEFRSRHGGQLSRLRPFVIFLSSLRHEAGWYCKLGHHHYLPHPSETITD